MLSKKERQAIEQQKQEIEIQRKNRELQDKVSNSTDALRELEITLNKCDFFRVTCSFPKLFPQFEKEIFDFLYAYFIYHFNENDGKVSMPYDLDILINTFPQYKMDVFQDILSQYDSIFINNIEDLGQLSQKQLFREYKELLFKYLIKEENFTRLIKNAEDLKNAEETFFPNINLTYDAERSHKDVCKIYEQQQKFTKGATAAFFKNIFKSDATQRIGFFLTPKDAGNLTLTNKGAVFFDESLKDQSLS